MVGSCWNCWNCCGYRQTNELGSSHAAEDLPMKKRQKKDSDVLGEAQEKVVLLTVNNETNFEEGALLVEKNGSTSEISSQSVGMASWAVNKLRSLLSFSSNKERVK
jgi:hypothetical protein